MWNQNFGTVFGAGYYYDSIDIYWSGIIESLDSISRDGSGFGTFDDQCTF